MLVMVTAGCLPYSILFAFLAGRILIVFEWFLLNSEDELRLVYDLILLTSDWFRYEYLISSGRWEMRRNPRGGFWEGFPHPWKEIDKKKPLLPLTLNIIMRLGWDALSFHFVVMWGQTEDKNGKLCGGW